MAALSLLMRDAVIASDLDDEHAPNRLGRIPFRRIGGLPIACLSLSDTVDLMIDLSGRRHGRPIYMTSANGEVMSRCQREPGLRHHVLAADVISADGAPMVYASRLFKGPLLPQRVATTDLFPLVAERAQDTGRSFYLFGASASEAGKMLANVRAAFPRLNIVGASHGYLRPADLAAKIDEIDTLAPDILWLGLGVPREQEFATKYGASLPNVGIIKTVGGLFNFLSGTRPRAPRWMQAIGMEWAWRALIEPRRLGWRYLVTNPHAVYLLLTETGGSMRPRPSLAPMNGFLAYESETSRRDIVASSFDRHVI